MEPKLTNRQIQRVLDSAGTVIWPPGAYFMRGLHRHRASGFLVGIQGSERSLHRLTSASAGRGSSDTVSGACSGGQGWSKNEA